MYWLHPNPYEEVSVAKVTEFVVHWDMGDYDVKRNQRFLRTLAEEFQYDGALYRGGKNDFPPPPVSWSKDKKSLQYYFTHIWGTRGSLSIPAWKTTAAGIDVEEIAFWFLKHEPQSKDAFRAKRLASFREVITLGIPPMKQIGTLVQTRDGVVLRS